MTLQHPLDKLSAVVDGELDHDSRDKVLSHLVGCDTLPRRGGRAAPAQGPDGDAGVACGALHDLMQRLLGVSSFSPEPREEVRPVLTPAVTLFPQRSAFPAGRSGGTRPGTSRTTRSRRRTGVLGAAGSAAAVASLLGTAFVVGDPSRSEQPPVLQPPVGELLVRPREHDGRYAVRRPGRAAELLQRGWVRRAEPDAAAGGPDRTLTREPLPARRPGQHRSDRLRPAHARLRDAWRRRGPTRRPRSAGWRRPPAAPEPRLVPRHADHHLPGDRRAPASAMLDIVHAASQGSEISVVGSSSAPGAKAFVQRATSTGSGHRRWTALSAAGDVPAGLQVLHGHHRADRRTGRGVAGRPDAGGPVLDRHRRPDCCCSGSCSAWTARRWSARRCSPSSRSRTRSSSGTCRRWCRTGWRRSAWARSATCGPQGWICAPELPASLKLYDVHQDTSNGSMQFSYSDGLFNVSLFEQRGALDPAAVAGFTTPTTRGRRLPPLRDAVVRRLVVRRDRLHADRGSAAGHARTGGRARSRTTSRSSSPPSSGWAPDWPKSRPGSLRWVRFRGSWDNRLWKCLSVTPSGASDRRRRRRREAGTVSSDDAEPTTPRPSDRGADPQSCPPTSAPPAGPPQRLHARDGPDAAGSWCGQCTDPAAWQRRGVPADQWTFRHPAQFRQAAERRSRPSGRCTRVRRGRRSTGVPAGLHTASAARLAPAAGPRVHAGPAAEVQPRDRASPPWSRWSSA